MDVLLNHIKNNGIPISVGVYLIVMAYYLTKDPEALYANKTLYGAITIIPAFIGLLAYFKGGAIDPKKLAFAIVGTIFVLYLITTFFSAFLVSSFIQLIIILMIVVALAILYKLTYVELYKMNNMTGLIANFIFYIPCMLLNLLEYISSDLKQAPKVVYLLLVIEAILLALYITVPKIMNAVTKTASIKDGTPVILEPVRLDNVSSPTSYIKLQPVQPNPGDIINNKYAISAWVYIVPLPSSTVPYNNDANIYKFSTNHPRLMYNGPSQQFKCYLNSASTHEFTMPLQHWNHVVTNYTKSGVDLFINGELIHTVPRDSQNESLTMGDIIEIGQDNGLTGGVCNMVYFSRPLLKTEIESIYSLNKDRDPPAPL